MITNEDLIWALDLLVNDGRWAIQVPKIEDRRAYAGFLSVRLKDVREVYRATKQ